jgi:hypothetical protein
VPALERLGMGQISSRFVSQEEGVEIADLRHAQCSGPSLHFVIPDQLDASSVI